MRKLVLAVLGTSLIATGLVLTPASGSSPSTSALTVPGSAGKKASATYTGTIPPGANANNDCSTQPTTLADAHGVKITAPSGGYTKVGAVATFSIAWTPPAAEDTADEILTLLAPDGSPLGSSDGSTTTETVTLTDPPSGTYTMLACGFANALPQSYKGTISVATAKKVTAGGSGSTAGAFTDNRSVMRFTPATIVDPLLFGAEPGITFDRTTNGHRLFADWPVSSRTNIGAFYRSTDGGLSFTKRYADVNDVAGSDGPACAGRQVPYCPSGGGGDTDTQVDPTNGHIYFSSQESLANEASGTSFDHGTTFPASHVDPVTQKAGGDVDRQWLGFWKGTSTVFLAYHSPVVGAYVVRSDQSGATGSWSVPASPQIPFVAQTGSMEVDNTGGIHNHAIYIAYVSAIPDPSALLIETLHVAVSTDGAKTFTSYAVPGGDHPKNFTKLYLDTKGNLYAVWTDSTTWATYLATSKANVGKNRTAPGSVWKGPYRISAAPANITIFPDVRAGTPGRMAAIYYGTKATAADPDSVKPGQGGWYPYVAFSKNALCMWAAHPCKSPSFHQMRVAEKVNHDDNICTAGTTCAVTGGNRNMADYWDIDLDRNGHLGFIWDDTTNAIGGPFVKVAREARGPSLFKGKPSASLPLRGNGYPDKKGDARFPIAGALIKTAKNHPTLDLRGTSVRVKGSNLEFRIALAKGSHLGDGVPTGNDGLTPLQQAKYVVRWDDGFDSYYAGANVPAGGVPDFFSGKVSSAEGLNSATNPDSLNGFGNTYAPLTGATGHVSGNALVIDVPRNFVGRPTVGTRLLSVGTYSMVGPQDSLVTLTTLPITVDSSPTFDARLATSFPSGGPGSTPGGSSGTPGEPGSGGLATTGLPAALTVSGFVLLALAAVSRRTARVR